MLGWAERWGDVRKEGKRDRESDREALERCMWRWRERWRNGGIKQCMAGLWEQLRDVGMEGALDA